MFRSSRRGQIRGIDFSLSMIIFLLTMSQVLILTNNFIISNRAHQNTLARSSYTDGLARDMLFSEGAADTVDWENTPSSAINVSNWEFGLSTGAEVNPFKLGRISNWSISPMHLNYSTIKSGLDMLGKSFSIKVSSTINVNITFVDSSALPSLLVNGTVNLGGKGLNNSKIHLFTIDGTGSNISQKETQTNAYGNFSATIDVIGGAFLLDTVLTIGVIARYGQSAEAVDIHQEIIGSPGLIGTSEISVIESSANSAGYSVKLQTSKSGDSVNLTAIYVGTGPNSNNFTQRTPRNTVSYDTVYYWEADDFAIPENGMVVFVIHEYQGGALSNMGILTFPVLLDDNMGDIIVPTKIPNALSATITLTFEVRRVLMTFTLTIWEA